MRRVPTHALCCLCLTMIVLVASPGLAARVEVILDVSGSMIGQAGGEPKIDAARSAIQETVAGLEEGSLVALRYYGHRVDKEQEEESCRDSELVIPFEPLKRARFVAALDRAVPRGQTPIAHSLELAARDFGEPSDEQRVIILVSDGEETCGGDPEATARKLIEQGFQLRVHTIGFDVDAAARAQLQAISRATGGEYQDAGNAAALAESLRVLAEKETPDIAPEPSDELARGLVLHYPFDGDAHDASGNRNHGAVHGATPTEDRFGNREGAYRLTLNDAVASAREVGIVGSGERTLAAWIRWDSLHAKDFTFVAGWGTPSAPNQNFAISTEWRAGSFPRCNQGQVITIWLWGTRCVADLNSTVVPKSGRWYHVVGSYDGRTVRIYVDGALGNSRNVLLKTGASRFYIGSDKFDGAIDDVRVYDRALSESEIVALYGAGE